MIRRAIVFVAALAMMGTVAGAGALAPGSGPLPAFTVVSSSGAAVPSARLSGEPRWLLVWARPGAAATKKLLTALVEWQLPQDSCRRIVVVFEGPAAKAAAYLASLGDSADSGAAWYADENGTAASALGITGAVALRGVRDGAIEWSLDGVLNDPAAFESVLRAWVDAAPAAR